MNRFQLYKLLRKNTTLSYKRSPAFEQNKWAKAIIYVGGAFFAIYLIMYGTLIGMTAEGDVGTMIAAMTLVMPIDFMLRFIVQTTPGMMVKPYILQPISRYTAIECFLISEHVSAYNLLWLAMFIPYSVIILVGGAGFGPMLLELLTVELLIIFNSQIYLFFRTLINRNVLWFIPAAAFYALPFSPALITMNKKVINKMIDTYIEVGTSWYFILIVLALIVALFFINRWFQFKYVYEEISKKEERKLKHVSQFSFLNRFGIVGEYLKIELKSNMRNKTMRSRCIISLTVVIFFSLIIAYTEIYNGELALNFWGMYCFAIYGITVLVKIMGQEGNYIDLLMTHRENIIAVLEAKYWFYTAVLVIPFLIMLPAVFTGKYSVLMLLAYMLMTAGLLHFIIFQLAVYNKQTLPLQQKMTAKGNFENGRQLAIELTALIGPIVLTSIGLYTIGMTNTYLVMIGIGGAFVATHKLWIRNIYKRMMERRYENLEGFHGTRQ